MADAAAPTKRKPDSEDDLIDNMDILANFEVLRSERDWRMLKDSDHLNKYMKKTADKTASEDNAAEEKSHD